jgi:hypothetical protein
MELTICGTVRGVVAANLVYRAAREAIGDTDLPSSSMPGTGPWGAYQRVIESVWDEGLLWRLAPGEDSSAAHRVLRGTYLCVLE